MHTDGPLLVLAGAGSGKTRVITSKIVHLVQKEGVRAERIAAVTFTNKAAREMKARIGKVLRGDAARGLRVCTFHRLGLEILRSEARQLDLRNPFSIIDPTDAVSMLTEIIQEQNNAQAALAPTAHALISNWKNQLVTPAAAARAAESEGEAAIARWYADYQRYLRTCNSVDLDDLILLPAQLFQEDGDVLEKWQQKIRYLLVDEYQDTNAAQYELVRLLTGHRQCFTVVGDDDQSIYAWRGARPDNLARLSDDFPRLEIVKLEQNYRSTGRILKVANALIAENPHLFEKKLWSELGFGPEIRVVPCDDEEAEAERIAVDIQSARARQRYKLRDFAILYRGNHQARPLELAFQRHRIPYKVSGGTSFLSRQEVRDVVAYIRLLANPDDDAAFLRIINTPKREIGPGTLEKLAGFSRELHQTLYSTCQHGALSGVLGTRAANRLREFSGWLDQLRELAGTEDPMRAIREMLNDLQFEQHLRLQGSTAAADFRVSNVEALLENIELMLRRENVAEKGLEGVVAALSLQDLLDRQENDAEDDRVHLLTLHAAKGLEFPCVFMVGLEEGLLPHRSTIEADDVSEERRLAYVGITRAQKALTLTFARTRKVQGKRIDTQPSRFLDELPGEDISWLDGEAAPTGTLSQRRAQGRDALADLRAMLEE